MRSAYDRLNIALGIKARPIPPRAFVPRLVSELGLSAQIARRALEMAGAAEDLDLGGAQPMGVAAGCVYAATRDQDESIT